MRAHRPRHAVIWKASYVALLQAHTGYRERIHRPSWYTRRHYKNRDPTVLTPVHPVHVTRANIITYDVRDTISKTKRGSVCARLIIEKLVRPASMVWHLMSFTLYLISPAVAAAGLSITAHKTQKHADTRGPRTYVSQGQGPPARTAITARCFMIKHAAGGMGQSAACVCG